MRAFKILLFLSFLSTISSGQQLNKLGNPLIKNFLPEDYDGPEQNYSIIQDERGIMYFGNYAMGILEYDGITWRMISVPNNAPVNSFAKDDKGTIYVGTQGDFGYLAPDASGSLSYVSLVQSLNDTIKSKLSHIYKTHFFNNKVYFCSLQYIFIYDGKNLKPIYLGSQNVYSNFLTFLANDHIYIGSYVKGLRELENDSILKIAPNGSFFERTNIYSIVPLKSKEILLLTNKGLFKYNQITGNILTLDNKNKFISHLINNSILPYCGIRLNANNIGIGTVQSDNLSYFQIDTLANPQEKLSMSNGLQASQILSLYQSTNSPTWMAFYDGGISKAETNSAIRRFGEESGINGIIVDIIEFNNTIYIATFNGVLYLTFNEEGVPEFKPVKNITGTVWDLVVFKTPDTKIEKLLAGSYVDGVYEIKNDEAISISDKLENKFNLEHKCYKLYQSPYDPSILYIGMASGITYIKYQNNDWIKTEYIEKNEIRFEIRSIAEDSQGNLWLGTSLNGVFLITPNKIVKNFQTSDGLPSLKQNEVIEYKNKICVLTTNGIYEYNNQDSTFKPSILFGDKFMNKGIYRIAETNKSFSLSCYNEKENRNWIELIEKDSLSNPNKINGIPFKRLPNKWADALYIDNHGNTWIGMSKELYTYNSNTTRSYSTPFNALIRKVTSKEDTVLFHGSFYKINDDGKFFVSQTQQTEQILKLPYRFNRLVFEFGSTFYEWEEETTFSYYLEGSDETWSLWNKEAKATYTNLREGSYTFKVKAKNIYGTESTIAIYKFILTPPWFRTILAYIVYGILFIAFVWILVRWNTRRLIAEKERLEQIVKERTAEVVRQKGEIELQRDKIVHQNEEIKSSIQYASRIQGAILTPQDQLVSVFPNHFILYLPRDIVSGDFYQIIQVGNKKLAVVADCTGHGVPGGFMSMLGMSFISQIINRGGELHPGDILNQLRASIIHSLHQTGEVGGSKDGMDIALFTIDETTKTIEFAGANNPLILIRDNEVQHIKGDKMPIGIHIRVDEPFTNNVIELKPGDRLYTFSDGYADQFGGPDQRKFMIKNLKELLLEIHQKPMAEQKEILHQTLLNWHGSSPRIDDVVVMGVQM